jgi:NAD(P)-dependent dehydrogenase (short-subunit alcohol dehydrogenase family)
MKKLKNKTALVTGASRGIGKAIAIKLAEEGACVIVHYANNGSEAEKTLQEIRKISGNGYAIQADLSDMQQINSLFEQLDHALQGAKLDILVNNAAILIQTEFDLLTEREFDDLFNVNVKAPYFLTIGVLTRMNDGARILNLSSTASKRPRAEICAYSMTKAAIDNFTRSLAGMLGKRRITVNAIAPGTIDTDMNKERLRNEKVRSRIENSVAMRRIGNAADIAEVVAFLASDAGEWITGQYIEASGGASL